MERLIPEKEAANMIGRARKTMANARYKGQPLIKTWHRQGRNVFYHASDIETYLKDVRMQEDYHVE